MQDMLCLKSSAREIYFCGKVDLDGRALLPAFVDTHQHFASFSIFNTGLNVMDAASNIEIAEQLKAFVKTSTAKSIIAFGASPHSVKEGRLITREEIDAVCPDREVMVVKYDGTPALSTGNSFRGLIRSCVNSVAIIRIPERLTRRRSSPAQTTSPVLFPYQNSSATCRKPLTSWLQGVLVAFTQ